MIVFRLSSSKGGIGSFDKSGDERYVGGGCMQATTSRCDTVMGNWESNECLAKTKKSWQLRRVTCVFNVSLSPNIKGGKINSCILKSLQIVQLTLSELCKLEVKLPTCNGAVAA